MPHDNSPEPPPPLLTTAEVAAIFNVGIQCVSRWVLEGKMAATRTPGGRLRFRQADVLAYLRDEK